MTTEEEIEELEETLEMLESINGTQWEIDRVTNEIRYLNNLLDEENY